MPKKLMPMLVVALLIPVAGCKTTGSGGTNVCATAWKPISWSQKDTTQTINEVKGNNARHEAWCKGS